MRRKTNSFGKKARRPKMKLGLPDLDQAKSAVLNSLRSPESKRGYQHSIDEFIAWYCSEPRLFFNKTVVTHYRIHLETRQLVSARQQKSAWEASSAFAVPLTTRSALSHEWPNAIRACGHQDDLPTCAHQRASSRSCGSKKW